MSVSLVEHVNALTTVDGCVCFSVGTCQFSDHCGLVCLWMGMSMSLVEHVSALITVDGCVKHVSALTTVDECVCVTGATGQCSDHRGWVYKTCQCSNYCG